MAEMQRRKCEFGVGCQAVCCKSVSTSALDNAPIVQLIFGAIDFLQTCRMALNKMLCRRAQIAKIFEDA